MNEFEIGESLEEKKEETYRSKLWLTGLQWWKVAPSSFFIGESVDSSEFLEVFCVFICI